MGKITGVRSARRKLGITQEELSKRSGVSRVTIARIESRTRGGEWNAKLDTLSKLACALNITVDDLLKAKESA